MGKGKLYIAITSFVMASSALFAQSTEDIYRISFKNRASGTARSAAMAGAFTSLGADASSIHINPAGIGMYRSSEMSITPSLFISNVKSESFEQGSNSLFNNKGRTSFGINNISSIFNMYNNEYSKIVSFNLGISYNKDRFSKSSSFTESLSSQTSIGHYFAGQLEGIKQKDIDNEKDTDKLSVYRSSSPGLWGAIMGYNNFLVEPIIGETDRYDISSRAFDNTTDRVIPEHRVNTKTMIDNFSFSAGANISNALYLGMTMGSRTYEYARESNYDEFALEDNKGDLNTLNYFQENKVYGESFDFKIGATLAPIDGLKIGIAYHAPTITYIKDEYYSDMRVSYYNDNNPYDQSTPYDVVKYTVKTAPSLLAGISYRIPYAILSFDYQRSYYNKMEVRDMGSSTAGFNSDIRAAYKAADSYMVGIELQPINGIFIRGGYAYYGSAYANSQDSDYGITQNISFGLGYRKSQFYIDLAYINSSYKVLPYTYFEGTFKPKDGDDYTVASPSTIYNKISDNTISLTFGLKF